MIEAIINLIIYNKFCRRLKFGIKRLPYIKTQLVKFLCPASGQLQKNSAKRPSKNRIAKHRRNQSRKTRHIQRDKTVPMRRKKQKDNNGHSSAAGFKLNLNKVHTR